MDHSQCRQTFFEKFYGYWQNDELVVNGGLLILKSAVEVQPVGVGEG